MEFLQNLLRAEQACCPTKQDASANSPTYYRHFNKGSFVRWGSNNIKNVFLKRVALLIALLGNGSTLSLAQTCNPDNSSAPPFCSPTLTCPGGAISWSQSVNSTDGAPALFRLVDGATEVYNLPISLPTAFNGGLMVTVNEAIAWDGYTGRNSVSQPNEKYRIVFFKNNVIQATSNWTGDVSDNKTQSYWKGGLGTVYLPNGADKISIVHWGAPTASGGQNDGSNPNSVTPTGVCITYTTPSNITCACPSANLINNPNFDSNTSGWTATNGQVSLGTGGQFGNFLVLNNNDLVGDYFIYQDITIGADQYYNFTGYAAKHSGPNSKVFLEFYNGSTKIGFTPDFFVTKNYDGTFQAIPPFEGYTPTNTTKIRIVGYANGTALKLDKLSLTTCYSKPIATAASNSPVCVGNTITLSAAGGTAYSWSGSGFNSGSQNPTRANATTAMSGVYTVSITNSNSCSNTATVSVVVNPKPSATASSNSPVCEGSTINLSSSGGTSYSWSGPNGFTASIQNPTRANATSTMSGIYTVSVSNSNSCSNTATVSVEVNPKPSATASSNSPVCEGSTINLSSSGGFSYSWSGPDGFATTQQNPTIDKVTTSKSGVYTVTVRNQDNCSATATVSVKGNPLPSATASSNSPVCLGNTINLSASGGTSYSWSGPGFSSTEQNPSRTNAAVAMSGTYSVTVKDANSCVSTASTSVTVNTATATASANSPVCIGASIQLSATGGGNYSWTGPLGFSSTEQNPTRSGAVTAYSGVYSVSVTSTNKCSASATTSVLINAQGASASSNSPVCSGKTIQLNASAGGTSYSWSGPSAFASTQQNPTRSIATTSMAGVYSVTIVGTNNCTGTATTSVIVNPSPNGSATSNSPVCEGKTINLSANGGITYSWAGPNGFVNTQQNPTITISTTTANGIYSVTIIASEGCTATATTSVSINPKPTTTATSNGPVCAGSTLNLSASGGTTYTWAGPSFNSTQQNPQVTNVTLANQGIYTVTVGNATGCTQTATVSVQISEIPKAAASSNSPICENTAIQLSANGGGAYSWSGPGGFTATGNNPSIPNASVNKSGIYSVTVTGANSCIATATTSVQVVPVKVEVSSNSPICAGSTLSLTATGGTTYTWSGPNGFTATGATPSIPSATTAQSGIYSVRVIGSVSCTASATVSVQIKTQGATANSNSPICEGGTINLSSSSGGSSYSWSGPNFSSTIQNPTRANANSTMSGVYTVTVGGQNSCTGTATVSVSVNSKPIVQTAGGGVVCVGATIILSASGGVSYSWSGPNNFSASSATPTISNATTANIGTYSVTVSNSTGCTASATASVSVNTTSATASSNSPVCEGGTINLSASAGSNYSWAGPGFSSTAQNPTRANANSTMSGVYSVTVGGQNSCTGTATTSVVVLPKPTASITVSNNGAPVCVGGSITLSASGGTSYTWSGPVLGSSTQNPLILSNITTANAGIYTVLVKNEAGCANTATASVGVSPPPSITVISTASCEGGTITLSATGGGSYNWTGPGGFTASVQNPTRQNITSTMSGVYSVTVISTASCSATGTTSVKVKLRPTFNLTTTPVTCTGPVANSDGKIIIKDFNPEDRYQFLGVYTGTIATVNTYDESTPIPANGVIVSNLPNPSKPTEYVVLVFTKEGCSNFKIVTLEPVDCQCPPAKCVPFTITKKSGTSSGK